MSQINRNYLLLIFVTLYPLTPASVRFYDTGPCMFHVLKSLRSLEKGKGKQKKKKTTGPPVFAGSHGIKLGGYRYCSGVLGRAQGRTGRPRPRGASRQRRTKHPPVHLRIDLNSQLLLLLRLLLFHHRGGRRVRKHAGTPRLKQHDRKYRGGCRVGKHAGAHRLKQHHREYGGGCCVGCTPGRPV